MFHLSEQQKDLHNVTYDDVVIPCSQTKELSFLANSWDDTHINFDCKFSRNDLIDREVFIEYEISFEFEAATIGYKPILSLSEFCLSQNPLSRVTDKNKVVINGSCVSEIDNDFRAPLSHYRIPESTIEIPDVANNIWAQARLEDYDILSTFTAPNIDDWKANHMLINSHFRNSAYSQMNNSRGSIQPKSITFSKSNPAAANDDAVTLVYRLVERVYNPAFMGEKYSVLANVENLEIQYKLNELLPMFQFGVLMSLNVATLNFDKPAYENVSLSTTYKPRLLFKCYVPTVPIPRSFTTKYIKYNKLVVPTLKLTAAGVAETAVIDVGEIGYFKSSPISLSQVPNSIYLFVRPTNKYKTIEDADSYCVINSLKFITASDNGVFSNCDQYQLYSMCKRNGLMDTFEDFSDMVGSIIKIDMEKSDISGFIAGEIKPFQFEIYGEFTNTAYSSYDYDDVTYGTGKRLEDFSSDDKWSLNMIFEYEGKISITNTSANIEYGISPNHIAKILKKKY